MTADERPHPCDLFRPLVEVQSPDPRHAYFSVRDRTTGQWCASSIEDHHAEIAALELGEHVPGEIRIGFDTARNVLLYAWYVYRFHQAAELLALSVVESALRRRLGFPDDAEAPKLGRLLELALDQGLIRADRFRQYERIVAGDTVLYRILAEHMGMQPQIAPAPNPEDYARLVVRFLKEQRNTLAHGSNMLYPPSAFLTMGACCDLINQVFAGPKGE